jgi:phosphoserine phosphatase
MATEHKEIILLKFLVRTNQVTAGLTGYCTYNAIVLDIGQADIHETLSLGFCSKLKRVLLLPCFKRFIV